jgi:hypothetical protein
MNTAYLIKCNENSVHCIFNSLEKASKYVEIMNIVSKLENKGNHYSVETWSVHSSILEVLKQAL